MRLPHRILSFLIAALLLAAVTALAEEGVGPVALERLELPEAITLGVGEKLTLEPALTPADAPELIHFSTDASTIADVNAATGTITAVAPGEAHVFVEAEGGLKATTLVTVLRAPSSLALNSNSLSLYEGNTYPLSPKFPNGVGGSVRYTSSDPSVAEVDAEGHVKAVSQGNATIIVQSYNGKFATCSVTVEYNVASRMTEDAAGRLEVLFMDIGRNDGILLHCDGEYAFIDSGERPYGQQARNFLFYMGIPHLKYYIGTHAHTDHVAGAPVILATIPADRVIVPHQGVVDLIRDKAATVSEWIAVNCVPFSILRPGQKIMLGGATMECLAPMDITQAPITSTKENHNSLVLRVTYGKRTLLLTGDASATELRRVREQDESLLKVDVLKNPHHNSSLGSAYEWFGMKYVIASTSSSFLPSASMRAQIERLGATLYCTASSANSSVLMVTDGESLEFYPTHS